MKRMKGNEPEPMRVFSLLPVLTLAFLLCACGNKDKAVENDPVVTADSEEGVSREKAVPGLATTEGKRLYERHCLVCHQATGGGVPGLNPPLRDTDYVLGDKERLIDILINGSNEGLVVLGTRYANAMPGFPHLSNGEIAEVATFIRNSFGNTATAVSAAEVADFRKK